MAERLDEERLEILRSWGAGLSNTSREELRAAGKAITILIDEIEQLHVDLWHAGAAGSPPPTEEPVEPARSSVDEHVSSQELATSLRDRIRGAIAPRSARDPQQ